MERNGARTLVPKIYLPNYGEFFMRNGGLVEDVREPDS